MAKLSIFVACPYSLFPLDDYKRIFATVTRAYDVRFKFADEQITSEHILAKITKYIRESDFPLFDITGWNPNVALELGIAVGLSSKYFILLNTKIEQKETPSDIKGIDRIHYRSNLELEAKLKLLVNQELPESRGSSDSAFESIRAKISKVLREKPGLGLTKLSMAVENEKTLVQPVARVMVQRGELTTKGAKKGTVYFAPDTAPETLGEQLIKALSRDARHKRNSPRTRAKKRKPAGVDWTSR
jgi:hypothetical protein